MQVLDRRTENGCIDVLINSAGDEGKTTENDMIDFLLPTNWNMQLVYTESRGE